MDIYNFFDAIETLSRRFYKNQEEEMSNYHIVNDFLEMCLNYFEEFA